MSNTITSWDDVWSIIGAFKSGFVVTWFYHNLFVDKIIEGKIPLRNTDLEDLVRMRIFNDEKEVHLWRSGKKIMSRSKSDDGIPNKMIHKTQMIVAGKIANQVKDLEASFKDEKIKVAIETHNYIDFNEIGQAGYVDCRFVKFVPEKTKK